MSEKKALLKNECVPCQGDVEPLKNREIEELLEQLQQGWYVIEQHHLEKEKAAFHLYTDLADVVENQTQKETFLSLAQEEAKHKLRFEIEYDATILKED